MIQKKRKRIYAFLWNSVDDKQSYHKSKDKSRIGRKPFLYSGELLPWLSREEVGWKRQGSGRDMRFPTRDHLVYCHPLNSSRSMWMPWKYRCLSNTNAFSEVNVCVYMKRTYWKYRKLRGSCNKISFLFAYGLIWILCSVSREMRPPTSVVWMLRPSFCWDPS